MFKKIGAILIALVFILGLSISAIATEKDTIPEQKSDVRGDIYLSSYGTKTVWPGESFDIKLDFCKSISCNEEVAYLYLSNNGFKMINESKNVAFYPVYFKSLYTASVDMDLIAPTSLAAGTSSLDFVLKYAGNEEGYMFSIPINVMEIVDYSDDEEPEPEKKPESNLTPHIILTSYKLSGKTIEAGKDINLSVSFKNTSKKHKIENIIVNYALPAGTALKDASSNFYIESLPAGETISQTITLISDKTLISGIQNFGISFDYQYMDNEVYLNGNDNETFSLRVSEQKEEEKEKAPDRFEISSIDLPDTVYLGSDGYITINMINKGANPLHNVTAKINSTNIKNDGDNEYFGMLAANTKDEVELCIQPLEEGSIIGTITIMYEHEDGEAFEVTRDFSVFCEDPNAWMGEWEEPIEPPYEEPVEQKLPNWAIYAIAGGIIAIIIIIIVVNKKKKKKMQEELDDEDI